jgi:hypothetical protein
LLFTSIQARAGGKDVRLDTGYGSITFKGRDFTFRMSYTKDYDTPNEKLSYSELKDRIREECVRMFQKKKQWQ